MENEKVDAHVYGSRIVCGKCGFMIAEVVSEKKPNGKDGVAITILCRRKHNNGESCRTINEIKI